MQLSVLLLSTSLLVVYSFYYNCLQLFTLISSNKNLTFGLKTAKTAAFLE